MRYIYRTTNQENGRVYIGQRHAPKGVTPEKDKYLGSGTLLLAAIAKYGRLSFLKEILHICKNQEEADRIEIYEIAKHREELGRGMVYNMSSGGQFMRPDDHRETTSAAMKRFYSNPKNIKTFHDKINQRRKEKGMPSIEEAKIIKENKMKERRVIAKRIAEEKKKAREERRAARIERMNSPEYKQAKHEKKCKSCKEVFYKPETLAAFREGIKARSKNKEWVEKQKENIGTQTQKQVEQCKIETFGEECRYYVTLREYARLIGMSASRLDHQVRDGKIKPDARAKICGKHWAFFDTRKLSHDDSQQLFILSNM